MKNGVLKLEDLSWTQLERLDKEKSIFFVIISPLEEHGPHLPVGVDFFIAQNMARTVAREFKRLKPEWSVVLCPGLPLGTQCIDLMGTITIRHEVLRDVAIDFISSMAKYGFKYFVIITGHMAPGHGVVLKEAAEIVNSRYKVKVISPTAELVYKLRRPEPGRPLLKGMPRSQEEIEETRNDIHGGKRETSLMLSLKPRLVDKCYKELSPTILEDPANINGAAVRKASRGLGYLGNPAQASASFGRILSQGLRDLTVQLLLEMVK